MVGGVYIPFNYQVQFYDIFYTSSVENLVSTYIL